MSVLQKGTEEYHRELEARGRQLLEHIASSASTLWGAQALMAMGDEEGRAEEIIQKYKDTKEIKKTLHSGFFVNFVLFVVKQVFSYP